MYSSQRGICFCQLSNFFQLTKVKTFHALKCVYPWNSILWYKKRAVCCCWGVVEVEKKCVRSITRIKMCKRCQLMSKTKASKLQFSVNCGIITDVNGPSLRRSMTQSLNDIFRKAETGKVSSSFSIKRMATKIMIEKNKESFVKPDTIWERSIFTEK